MTAPALLTAALGSDVGALLRAARRARSVADRRHVCDVLQRTLLGADPGAVASELRVAARTLGVDAAACAEPGLEVPPHAVLVPLVSEALGVALVRQMRIAFELSSQDGYALGLQPSAARAVSDALEQAARQLGRSAEARSYCLATVHPEALSMLGERALVDGPSLGAAAFVSAVSLWSERPVRRGTLVTGKLVGDRVLSVGAVDLKLTAAALTRADLERVVVPKAAYAQARRALGRRTIDVHAVGTVGELLSATLEPSPKSSSPVRHRVAELRRDFERGWQSFGWENVREHAERLIPAVPASNVDLRVDVLGMLGAAEDHLGSPARALEIFEQALALCASDEGKRWVPDAPLSRLEQHLANTYRRLFRLREARRAAAHAVRAAEHGRLRDELFKAYGCVGLVEWTAGESAAAIDAFTRAITLVHEHAPDSCVRSHGYLIDAYAQAGDAARVQQEYALANEHLSRLSTSRKVSAEAWLRTSYGSALFHLDEPRAAIEAFDAPAVQSAIDKTPLPGLWARRYLGLSLLQVGRIEEGQELLAASPFAYGALAAGPSLRFGADINVLCETWGLLSRGMWDRDIAGRARRVLERFPAHFERGPLDAARRRALRVLVSDRAGRKPSAAAEQALAKLITLCGRLS